MGNFKYTLPENYATARAQSRYTKNLLKENHNLIVGDYIGIDYEYPIYANTYDCDYHNVYKRIIGNCIVRECHDGNHETNLMFYCYEITKSHLRLFHNIYILPDESIVWKFI